MKNFTWSTGRALCFFSIVAAVFVAGAAWANLPGEDSFAPAISHRNEDTLIDRGYDVETGRSWPRAWMINPATSKPGRARISPGGAPGGGEWHLEISGIQEGVMHVFMQQALDAGKVYRWSLWAKGELEDEDAAGRPVLRLRTYEYGPHPEREGVTTYIGGRGDAHSPAELELTPEWKKYEGTVSSRVSGAEEIRFVLSFPAGARAAVDNVVIAEKQD